MLHSSIEVGDPPALPVKSEGNLGVFPGLETSDRRYLQNTSDEGVTPMRKLRPLFDPVQVLGIFVAVGVLSIVFRMAEDRKPLQIFISTDETTNDLNYHLLGHPVVQFPVVPLVPFFHDDLGSMKGSSDDSIRFSIVSPDVVLVRPTLHDVPVKD